MSQRFLRIELAADIRPVHVLAYLYAVLVSSGYAGALAVLQPGLLQVMGIPFEEQGRLTGYLAAFQELLFFVLLGVVGAVSDRVGRRSVYVAGLLTTALGFLLYPWAGSVGELFLYRLVIAVGSAAMLGMMVTVIADYSTNRTRGKANGVQAIVATLGAFIPPVLASVPAGLVADGASEASALQVTFAIAAGLGVSAALVAFLGLAPAATQRLLAPGESLLSKLWLGLRAARDPGIALSYGAAFISRGDLAVTGAFLGLWLTQHGVGNLGMTASDAMGSLVMPAVLVVVSGALVGAPLAGWLADRISRAAAIPVVSGFAALVYMSMFFVVDPSAGWVKGLLLLMGIAEISAFIASQALAGQQAEPHRRGAIFGFFGVAGAIGIFVGTTGGGIVFDAVGPSAPFVIFGSLNLLVCAWGLLVFRRVRLPDWDSDEGLSPSE